MRRRIDTPLLVDALRAGVREVVEERNLAGVNDAVKRVRDVAAAMRQRSNHGEGDDSGRGVVVTVFSAKGGCGATTIACHVAAELRRLTSETTLLADLDLAAGGAAFLMKAEQRHSILDATGNVNRLDASYWGALVTNCSGVDVVAAPETLSQAPPAASLSETMHFLRGEYRFVLADLGCGLFVVGLAALAFWQAAVIPVTPIYAQVGPKLVPYLIATGLAVLGIGLTVEALRGGWSRDLPEVAEAPPSNWRALGLLGAGLLANLALIEWLGFVVAATVQFVLVAHAFGSRHWLRDVGIGLAVTVAAYLGFSRVLGVNIGLGRVWEGLF